jgi:Domain of unknown function (DUF4261)
MGIFSRFFGRKEQNDVGGGKLVANRKIEKPLSLQVLFNRKIKLDSDRLASALRSYHRSMAKAQCEIEPELGKEGTVLGLAGWGKHVIRLVGFDLPMPADAVERCVAPSHYGPDLKQQARAHQSHVLLYYGGYEISPFEQYVALAAVGGALSQFGAIVIMNEAARTSFPADALSGGDNESDIMEGLRTLPLLVLYCGFVKYDVKKNGSVWMRAYGANLLGLPNFACLANGHHEGQHYFDMFENLYAYLRSSGAHLAAGHTSQVGENAFIRFRGPTKDEAFLLGDTELLIIENVGAG